MSTGRPSNSGDSLLFPSSASVHLLPPVWPQPRWPSSAWDCPHLQSRPRQVGAHEIQFLLQINVEAVYQKLLSICSPQQVQQNSQRVDAKVRHVVFGAGRHRITLSSPGKVTHWRKRRKSHISLVSTGRIYMSCSFYNPNYKKVKTLFKMSINVKNKTRIQVFASLISPYLIHNRANIRE